MVALCPLELGSPGGGGQPSPKGQPVKSREDTCLRLAIPTGSAGLAHPVPVMGVWGWVLEPVHYLTTERKQGALEEEEGNGGGSRGKGGGAVDPSRFTGQHRAAWPDKPLV